MGRIGAADEVWVHSSEDRNQVFPPGFMAANGGRWFREGYVRECVVCGLAQEAGDRCECGYSGGRRRRNWPVLLPPREPLAWKPRISVVRRDLTPVSEWYDEDGDG